MIRFLRPCWPAQTASAIVSEDRISTTVLKAPSFRSSRFDAPSNARVYCAR